MVQDRNNLKMQKQKKRRSQSYNSIRSNVQDISENPRISFNQDSLEKLPPLSHLCSPPKIKESLDKNEFFYGKEKLELIKKLSSFATIGEIEAKTKKKSVLFSMDVKQLTNERDIKGKNSLLKEDASIERGDFSSL